MLQDEFYSGLRAHVQTYTQCHVLLEILKLWRVKVVKEEWLSGLLESIARSAIDCSLFIKFILLRTE